MNEDRGARYQRRRRQTMAAAAACALLLIAVLPLTDAPAWLRDRAVAATGLPPAGLPSTIVAAATVAAVVVTGVTVLILPVLVIGRGSLDRRYRKSGETPAAGAARRMLLTGAAGVLLVVLVAALYTLLHVLQDAWWGPAWALAAGALFTARWVGPSSRIRAAALDLPASREPLRIRLAGLAQRLGVLTIGISVVPDERPTASVTGLGSAHRIVLSEGLLRDFSDDEIEVIMAHEMAHVAAGDVWLSMGLRVLAAGGALGCTAAALRLAESLLALRGPADPAGVPVVLLALLTGVAGCQPALYAWSRWRERRADRVALDLTRKPQALISAVRRLSAQTMADEQPSRLMRWLFYSHPPVASRLAMARTWEATAEP